MSRPEIVGSFGVVTSTHWLATASGMAVLEKGGNAFDAAVAAGCVLHIAEPDQNDRIVVVREKWSRAEQRVVSAELEPFELPGRSDGPDEGEDCDGDHHRDPTPRADELSRKSHDWRAPLRNEFRRF